MFNRQVCKQLYKLIKPNDMQTFAYYYKSYVVQCMQCQTVSTELQHFFPSHPMQFFSYKADGIAIWNRAITAHLHKQVHKQNITLKYI